MLTESLFVPNTSEKLFRNNSALWKCDPCNLAKVRLTWGDLLSKCWSCKEKPSRGCVVTLQRQFSTRVPQGQRQGDEFCFFSVLAAHKENSYQYPNLFKPTWLLALQLSQKNHTGSEMIMKPERELSLSLLDLLSMLSSFPFTLFWK